MGLPTTTSPESTRILPRMPPSWASKSTVALSVSILAMTSPALISSPSFLHHSTRVPVAMVGDRAGMVIRVWLGRLLKERAQTAGTACQEHRVGAGREPVWREREHRGSREGEK